MRDSRGSLGRGAIPWKAILIGRRRRPNAGRRVPLRPSRAFAGLHFSRMITLSRAIDGFESYLADERRFSPRTVLAYRSDLERFIGFWEKEFANAPAGKTPLSKVDTLALRSHMASLHRGKL